MSNKFYITTAIDYPNGSPHMGHAYEKIITDSYARWYKALGNSVYYLTGTDENGQKLQETAEAVKAESTQAYVDEQVLGFKNLCEKIQNSNDDFIRTTEPRHHECAATFWKKLLKKGDIYEGHYSGNYCMACENFYTELQAPDGICPDHNTELKLKEEKGFFFKLSEYSEWIIEYIKANEKFVTPKRAYNEILSRLTAEPVRDLAISRPNNGWGITVPDNEDFVMYTWFDALINYYSALPEDKRDLWPADLHVIGKDILWFHAVIWPCMLKALELPLPKQIYVHGMILAADGRKMSKSLGNGVDPVEVLESFPLDSFRYYLLKNISSNSDGSFSLEEMTNKHNTELGNDFGNLIMRVIKLSLKIIPEEVDGTQVKQAINFDETFKNMKEFMNNREHNKALNCLWEQVIGMNQYVNDTAPWALKNDLPAFKEVIYNCLYGIHCMGILIEPFLPETGLKTLIPLGVSKTVFEDIKFGEVNYKLSVPEALFPKIDNKS